MTYAHWALGLIHLDLLALSQAQHYLERSLALARETSSIFWLRVSTALLALVFIAQGEHTQAHSILEGVLGPAGDEPDAVEWHAQTAMQRLLWYARAELALACDEPRLALQVVEHLIACTTNTTGGPPALRLSKLRAEALMALGQIADALAVLRSARSIAAAQDELPLLWRIHLALGRLYKAQGLQAESAAQFTAAQAIVEELATNLEDAALQENFQRSAALLQGD